MTHEPPPPPAPALDASNDPVRETVSLIAQMRTLLGRPSAPPPLASDANAAAPRHGEDLWPPAPAQAVESAPEAPTFIDEEGEENTLPLEFATATMGHILLGQGRAREAREIFLAVLARDPDDAEARRGAEITAPAVTPTPPVRATTEAPAWAGGHVRALPVDPTTIVVFWELDRGAGYTLCVVSLALAEHGISRTERYTDDLPREGDWFVRDLPPGATHHVALGARRDGAFVPLVHAPPVTTARGGQSPLTATVQATVSLPATNAPSRPPRIVSLRGPRGALQAALRQVTDTLPTEGRAMPSPALHLIDPETGDEFDLGRVTWTTRVTLRAGSSEELHAEWSRTGASNSRAKSPSSSWA